MNGLIISFLSGALGGALITALFNYFSEKRKSKLDYLSNQINFLYGPLYMSVSHSRKLFENANSILEAHKEYFDGSEWSEEETTQRKIKLESKATISKSNEYVAEANANNEKIFNIISQNYSFIDPEDIDVFDSFIKNYTRLKVEYDADSKLPYSIARIVGDISFLPNDFSDAVHNKFLSKKCDLTNLSSTAIEKLISFLKNFR